MRIRTMALGVGGLVAASTLALAIPDLAAAASAPAPSSTVSTAEDGSNEDRRAAAAERIKRDLAELVDDGTITDAQAAAVADTLAERLGARMDGPGRHPGRHGHGGHPGPHGPRGGHDAIGGADLDAVAGILGLDPGELREKLADQTLGEITDDVGVSRDDVVQAIVDAQTQHLNNEVTEGDLAQDRADEIIARLQLRAENLLDRSIGERPGRDRDRMPGGPDDPADAPTVSPATETPSASPTS